jgi:hypothetical protein
MAHYAKVLRDMVDDRDKRLATVSKVEREFYAYLCGPKFRGECENHISVHEVMAWLDRIGAATIGADTYGD